MKKIIISVFILLFPILGFAQETEEEPVVTEGWKKSGKVSILFNQSAFSNWTAGGENTISGTLARLG